MPMPSVKSPAEPGAKAIEKAWSSLSTERDLFHDFVLVAPHVGTKADIKPRWHVAFKDDINHAVRPSPFVPCHRVIEVAECVQPMARATEDGLHIYQGHARLDPPHIRLRYPGTPADHPVG